MLNNMYLKVLIYRAFGIKNKNCYFPLSCYNNKVSFLFLQGVIIDD